MIREEIVYRCTACGTENDDDAKFCKECGIGENESINSNSKKMKVSGDIDIEEMQRIWDETSIESMKLKPFNANEYGPNIFNKHTDSPNIFDQIKYATDCGEDR